MTQVTANGCKETSYCHGCNGLQLHTEITLPQHNTHYRQGCTG